MGGNKKKEIRSQATTSSASRFPLAIEQMPIYYLSEYPTRFRRHPQSSALFFNSPAPLVGISTLYIYKELRAHTSQIFFINI